MLAKLKFTGVNFIHILWAAFLYENVFRSLAARKMLVKLTAGFPRRIVYEVVEGEAEPDDEHPLRVEDHRERNNQERIE